MNQSTAKVAGWVYLAELVNKLMRPAVTLLIARALSPSDYGVAAIAFSFASAASIIWTLGLSTALIQRNQDIDDAANVTFWLNAVLSSLTYIFLLVAGPHIGRMLGDPAVAQVLPIATITIVFDGLSAVHNALLQKELAFDKLFWRSTLPSAVPLLVTAPLAFLGYGYWSLIWGTVASSLISNLTLWVASPWRPHWHIERRVASEMVKFGLPTVGETFNGWFESQADKLALGFFNSVNVVGTYTVGVTIFALIYNFAFGPVKTVGYSRLCRARNSNERRYVYGKAQMVIMAAAFPIGIGVAVLATPISDIILLGKYPGLDVVLRLLAPYYIIAGIVSLGIPALRASAHSYLTLRLNLLSSFFVAVLYPLGARTGLVGFLIIKAIVQLLGSSFLIAIVVRTYSISIRDFWRISRPSIISAALMGLFLVSVGGGSAFYDRTHYWLWWSIAVAIGAAIYIVSNVLQNPQLVQISKIMIASRERKT